MERCTFQEAWRSIHNTLDGANIYGVGVGGIVELGNELLHHLRVAEGFKLGISN